MYSRRIETDPKLRSIRILISTQLWRADLGLEDYDELPHDVDMPKWVQERATKMVEQIINVLKL